MAVDRQADVDDLDLARQAGAVALEEAGFRGDEGDGADGGEHPTHGGAGVAGHTRGDVDGEDGNPRGDGRRVVGATEAGAVCGVDDEVDTRPGVADRADLAGGDDPHPGAATGEQPGGHPTVGPVVPPAAHQHHPAPVGTPQELERGPRHRSARPFHQDVEGRGGGGGRVHGLHLGDGQDRLHV